MSLAAKSLVQASSPRTRAITPRVFSHDDGPENGMFFGGIGTPCVGRDLDGRFARWHLEPGAHVRFPVEEAGLMLAWRDSSGDGHFPLDARALGLAGHPEPDGGYAAASAKAGVESPLSSAIDFAPVPGLTRHVSVLFPFMYEEYSAPGLPFTLVLEIFSPLAPGDETAASLPVTFFDAHIKAKPGATDLRVGVCFTWPNFLGWRGGWVSACDRGGLPWPGQYSAGNTCLPDDFPGSGLGWSGTAALQTRHSSRPVRAPLEGQCLIFAAQKAAPGRAGAVTAEFSSEACFKAGQNRIGRPAHEQEHTLAWARTAFARDLALPRSGLSWTAHWDEALGSAVASTVSLGDGESADLSFGLVMDCPLTGFGKGRMWESAYTARFGASGRNAAKISAHALQNHDSWLETLHAWQINHMERLAPRLGAAVAAAMLNELFFLNGGGSAWVSKARPDSDIPSPVLGNGAHFGIPEGMDIGYHYYNTLDLLVYAFASVTAHWPGLAGSVFADFLKTVDMETPQNRMIYREGEMRRLLAAGKLPHDLGAAPEDPWHDLNGYQMRDDSNAWLDHNPTFIISYFLHCRLTGVKPGPGEWANLKRAWYFMLSQSKESKGINGLPLHKAFGDSTWDNIGLKGVCAHSGSAVLAANAAMAALAGEFGEAALAREALEYLDAARGEFDARLWTGEYYRACDAGRYNACLMPDSLVWLMYAELAGLPAILPQERVRAHLGAAHRYAYKRHGFHGPLLICEPERASFPPDGGDIGLQVNEVLVGAAWAFTAHAYHAGLHKEALEMAADMAGYLQRDSTLQFRSPAAWDRDGRFRAPYNMRPLAIWLLALAAGNTEK